MTDSPCRFCGQPYAEHLDSRPPGTLVPPVECAGVKRYFSSAPEPIAPPLSADDLERIEREKADTEPSGPPSERLTMPEIPATEAVTLPPPEVD